MYAASFRTRCPIRNIEYTRAPINVTGSRSAARMATNTISAPGVSVPVTIASHSWNCTRISVAKKAPEPDQRRPRAMRSLGVDRSADDRRPVQEHERRLGRHHRGDHRALPLSAAQGDAETVTDLLEPHLRERLFGTRPRGVPGESSGAQVAVDLLARREVEERLPFLRHDRDERSHAFRFIDDVEAESMNPPGRRD